MDRTDYESEMVDTIGQKIEDELKMQSRKRQEFGIKCCQQNALILEDVILPKITGFYNHEMKLVIQNKISSIHLQLTHEDLKQECVESVKTVCCSFADLRILQFYCREIETALDKSFQLFSDTNQLQIDGDTGDIHLQTDEEEQQMQKPTEKLNLDKILNYYNESMKAVTQNRISSAELRLAHEKVKEECIKAIKMEISEVKHNGPQFKVELQEVDATLEKHFEFHKSNNERKVEIFMAKVNLVVKNSLDNYIHAMKSKLQQKSMTQPEIEELHEAFLNEASILLKKDLMPYQEDSEIHIQKLAVLTKQNFEIFVEENQKRILEEVQKKELENLEKLKQNSVDKTLAKERQDTLGIHNDNFNLSKSKSEISETLTANYLHKDTSFHESIGINSQTKPKIKSPIIAVEFGMRTVKMGVMLNGKFFIIPDRWGNTEFPNTVAITNTDEVLIGQELTNVSEVKFKSEISEIFHMASDELPRQMLHFRGKDILITKELLCGLILSKVKADAEVFLKSTVDSVVLSVPLCYTSTQRQAAKDAAIIGGFSTVHLITEPTAAALAYAQQPLRINSENPILLIVADNNYGVLLDAAVYRYKEGKVKMVTCAGSSHHDVPNVLRRYLQEAKGVKDGSFGESQKKVIKSFLKECVEDRDIVEFALICREGEDKSNILRIVNELCKNARPAVNLATDEAVLMGAAIFAELWNEGEKIAKSHISDLLPYQFECQRESAYAKKTSIVFARHDRLVLTERWNSFLFQSLGGCFKYKVYETGNVCNYPTGKFVVPISSPAGQKRNGCINFYVNWEGILRVTANYTDPKEEIVINYFPLNMNEEKIAQNASLVAFAATNPRLEEERRFFNDSKSELRVLAELVLANLTEVQSVFGKDQLEKRATAAIEALDHPNVTQEDVSNRISVLAKLKSKYNL